MSRVGKIGYISLFLFVMSIVFLGCEIATQSEPINNVEKSEKTVMDYKTGDTLAYNGKEYLVVRNTFLQDETQDSKSREVVSELDELTEYINKYLIKKWGEKDLRQKFLGDKGVNCDYIELFYKKSDKKIYNSDHVELVDQYIYLDKDFKPIADIEQIWVNYDFCKFFYSMTDNVESAEKFKTLNNDSIREYDFTGLELDVSSPKKQYKMSFDYFENANEAGTEKYGKVDYENPTGTGETFNYHKISNGTRPALRIEEDLISHKISYALLNHGQSAFSRLEVLDSKVVLNVMGDGKIGGSTDRNDCNNRLHLKYDQNNPLVVDIRRETERIKISNNNKSELPFSGEVKIQYYETKDGEWIEDTEKKQIVGVEELNSVQDFIQVSSEKISAKEIDGVSEDIAIPASITYHMHFDKDINGEYPAFDNYSKITCYPVLDGTENRIMYKVTQKSIEDYVNAWNNDFERIYAELN